MESKEDRPTTLREMSTSSNLKRIRTSTTSTNAPFVDNISKIALLEPYPEESEWVYPPMRKFLSTVYTFLPQEFAQFPPGRSTRPERSGWLRYTVKYALFCYFFLSCIVASIRLYTGLFHWRVSGEIVLGPGGVSFPSSVFPDNVFQELFSTQTVERFLLRSTAPSVTLEPFVLVTKPAKLNKVTICAWLLEPEIHHIERWLEGWHGNKPFELIDGAMLT
jgi:hypothetical protein